MSAAGGGWWWALAPICTPHCVLTPVMSPCCMEPLLCVVVVVSVGEGLVRCIGMRGLTTGLKDR